MCTCCGMGREDGTLLLGGGEGMPLPSSRQCQRMREASFSLAQLCKHRTAHWNADQAWGVRAAPEADTDAECGGAGWRTWFWFWF